MLRTVLLVIGLILLAVAAGLYSAGEKVPALYVFAQGALLTIAMLWEPWRYRRAIVDSPPPGFTPTAERYEDPSSGRHVTVYIKAATGERAYVAEKTVAGG